MSILTPEELAHRKDEARKREIRQNVKSHCTKIKEGIRKNGTTSGNRAIWELFQNAGDLARNGHAEIKITVADKKFTFAHKGKPFTDDTLCSLVKQVSSEDKENDDTVGQYGTGFLTTHKFGYNIVVNGSMLINENPDVFVDVKDFLIKRENFDNIPQFIEDMTEQVDAVSKLMDGIQNSEQREWTELCYDLAEDRLPIVQTAIDEAIKLMPYVLTFNDKISSCEIKDESRNMHISFTKSPKECSVEGLRSIEVTECKEGSTSRPINCYYLELHEGKSRIILPLESETNVCELKDIPRMYVHYPLIGQNFFGVNFIFHSHLFTPEEPRDNIIVPKGSEATDAIAIENKRVLDEMTAHLWVFLEKNVAGWQKCIRMSGIDIKDSGFTEQPTEDYYKALKTAWVNEFCKLPLIEIDGTRYSMADEKHPMVFEPTLYAFLSQEENHKFLNPLYEYAKGAALIPSKEEIMQWSHIIGNWAPDRAEFYLTLEQIVEHVSKNHDDCLHDILELVVATKNTEFFDRYALIPNRKGVLKKHSELRDARAVTDALYLLVNNLEPSICDKFIDRNYEDIISLTEYTRVNLRDELNEAVKRQEKECWNTATSKPYGGEFLKNLMALCSAFTTQNGESKRNKLMPVIYRFEGLDSYAEKYIPAWPDDDRGFDLYRNLFTSLLENEMMKVATKDAVWAQANIDDLNVFVEQSRGDDFKGFNTRYSIFPDMNYVLHLPEDLKKNENVHERLFGFYKDIMSDDLKGKCVHERFSAYYDKYNTDAEFKFTSSKVATELQNKLAADNYSDTKILDIIELTEDDSTEGLGWRALFKTIYDQRESIRYNLGTDAERKAINRMLKQKNPDLMEKMADVVEREDSDLVLCKLNEAISNMEDEAHKKMLGDFVEDHIERYLNEALSDITVNIRNEQGGQDLILSKEGYEDYYIEIKSRWIDKEPAMMSSLQFHTAVDNADRYALISAQMWGFDQQRVENGEEVPLSELEARLRVCDNIGTLEKSLLDKVEEALVYNEDEIHVVADYHVHVPQKLITQKFQDLIDRLRIWFK